VTGDGLVATCFQAPTLAPSDASVKVAASSHDHQFQYKYEGAALPRRPGCRECPGLMTATQLQQLGGVVQPIALAPARTVGIDKLRRERSPCELPVPRLSPMATHSENQRCSMPASTSDNVANKANFDPPAGFITSPLAGWLDGSPGSAGRDDSLARTNRYGLGSGVFSQGVPRALEVGMRLTF